MDLDATGLFAVKERAPRCEQGPRLVMLHSGNSLAFAGLTEVPPALATVSVADASSLGCGSIMPAEQPGDSISHKDTK